MLQSSAKAQVVTTVITGLIQPAAILIGTLDTLYVSEQIAQKIVKIDPAGTVSAFVGSGSTGSADGMGAAASFDYICGMVQDASFNIYATDYGNNSIRKITPTGVVTTFVSSGLNRPTGIVWGKNDTLIVYNHDDGTVVKIAPSGLVFPFTSATIKSWGLAKGSKDTLYLAGNENSVIYKIDPMGTITTLAGSSTVGSIDGTGAAASFYIPSSIAVDGAGDLYVTDFNTNKIRKVTHAGVVTTVAGSGTAATTNGTGTAASFYSPYGITMSPSTGNFYIADYSSGAIRKMTGGVRVGVKNIILAATELKVYPSPFSDGFTISSSTSQRAQIVNNLGQVVQTINIVAGEQQVPMAGQPAGIYYVKTENSAAQQIVKL